MFIDDKYYESLIDLAYCVVGSEECMRREGGNRQRSFNQGKGHLREALVCAYKAGGPFYGSDTIMSVADRSTMRDLREDECLRGLVEYSNEMAGSIGYDIFAVGGARPAEEARDAFRKATDGILGRDPSVVKLGRLEWRLLDSENGKSLYITKDIVEKRAWNSFIKAKTRSNSWHSSKMREYLNGPFITSYLSGIDRSRLCDCGAGKVFLLSDEEAYKYFRNDTERKCGGSSGWWWLRNVNERGSVGYVTPGGKISACVDSSSDYGVRTAIWLKN